MRSYGLSRHEPAALGRSIALVEDELSTEAAGTPLESRDTSKPLVVSQSLHPTALTALLNLCFRLRLCVHFGSMPCHRDGYRGAPEMLQRASCKNCVG